MAIIIDRRLNPSGKSLTNRQRFLERARGQIRETIKKTVAEKDIKEISKGASEKIKVKQRDISEPTFHNNNATGSHKRVLPGNKEYFEGDEIPKPQGGGSGQDRGEAGSDSDGLDDFEFILTREEFLSYLFDDLELPDFIKESLKSTKSTKPHRAGLTTTGSPANLNLIRTFKNSIGRRLALARPSEEEIDELKSRIESETDPAQRAILLAELAELEARRRVVPYIEENDLRYNLWQTQPNPLSQAVMFCLMDVSGSMGEKEKDIAKRFFLILYLFLERKYDTVNLRFIRHTTKAEEVDEQTFFYDKQTGGTEISSGLKLIDQIIEAEYPVSDWNIYIAQCTDGDNSTQDNFVCDRLIRDKLQPRVQYYAYVQVAELNRGEIYTYGYSAWPLFLRLSEEFKNIACKNIAHASNVWTVFRELFQK